MQHPAQLPYLRHAFCTCTGPLRHADARHLATRRPCATPYGRRGRRRAQCLDPDLSYVLVLPPVVLIPLEELTLDQTLDALLDDIRRGQESRAKLTGHLGNQRVVVHFLAALHHAHQRSVDLRLAILVHLLPRLQLLALGLFGGRHGAHLETQLLRCKVCVEAERVALKDVASLGLFVQNLELRACKALKRSLEIGSRDLSSLHKVRISARVRLVELQQNAHHLRRDIDLVLADGSARASEDGLYVGVAHVRLPCKSAA
mmetsp:Transcript_54771/g.108743  ORF Transcript_54771/g.108743 Transcript_54771/m.108743 type:complete len:259 (-) Transcript_54771:1727-2503(-)